MENIPAKAGWLWVKEGFALFRKQPMELSTLFLSYTFMMLAIGIIPFAGEVLPLILTPVFSMAFMQACVQVERGERVYPGTLLAGFRSPAFGRLALLGVFYLLAASVAIGASSIVDGGQFWKIVSGQIALTPETTAYPNLPQAMLLAGAIYMLASMAFWYAPPLIMWNGMGVGKAMFYSFFAVKKTMKAFIVYGLSWFIVGGMLPTMISSLIALVVGQAAVVTLILVPMLLIMTVVLYCSFYPTYTCIFGKREDAAAASPPAPPVP